MDPGVACLSVIPLSPVNHIPPTTKKSRRRDDAGLLSFPLLDRKHQAPKGLVRSDD